MNSWEHDTFVVGGSDEAAAHTAVQVAQAAQASAAARLRYARIAAPVDGVLIARSVEPGDGVQPGKVLMVLSPKADMQLVLQIDEKNLHLLRLNQAAVASADAYPNKKFDAELAYINPKVDPLRGSVEVKLTVPKPPAYLQQDMTVLVDLADEPTGNLDSKSADSVFELLQRVCKEQGTAVLFVTHNPLLAQRCDKTIAVVDGRVGGYSGPIFTRG